GRRVHRRDLHLLPGRTRELGADAAAAGAAALLGEGATARRFPPGDFLRTDARRVELRATDRQYERAGGWEIDVRPLAGHAIAAAIVAGRNADGDAVHRRDLQPLVDRRERRC